MIILRIYDEVRTAHLERLRDFDESSLLYRLRSYDFSEAEAFEVPAKQMSRTGIYRFLWSSKAKIVELNEPSLLGAWPTTIGSIGVVRLSDAVRRRRTRIVFYAIDNLDPAMVFTSYTHLPYAVSKWLVKFVMRAMLRGDCRIAFGTDGSLRMYEKVLGTASLRGRAMSETAVFEALPAPCSLCDCSQRNANDVLFLGAFDGRKGIVKLMQSWDLVLAAIPDARLTILGKGEKESLVRAWVDDRENVELIVDPPRSQIHDALRRAHCLVLLSVRTDRWREQVGLPIVEGLAHGCEIVATNETGLSSWLNLNGHGVVNPDATPGVVARSIVRAIESRRSKHEVLGPLPRIDARLAADRWLVG